MADATLRGCRILVVEDEYLIADDLEHGLAKAGAIVLGPYPSVEAATAVIERGETIHFALLDINLRGEMIYPLAEMLERREIPFAFATGYDELTIPDRFAHVARVMKPLQASKLTETLLSLRSAATA